MFGERGVEIPSSLDFGEYSVLVLLKGHMLEDAVLEKMLVYGLIGGDMVDLH
jgi:hypothetical protein